MKNKDKFPVHPSQNKRLTIEYLHQECRGLSSFPQKKSGVFPFRPTAISEEDAELGAFLGKTIVSLLDKMEKSVPARDLKLNHRSITGWISGGSDEGQIQFESTLERDFAYLAFFDRRVFGLQAQPFTLEYNDSQGTPRVYTPDFQLQYRKSREQIATAVVEIKYQQELEEKQDEFADRFAAMENWCSSNNAEFHIVTDLEIRSTRISNVKALYPFNLSEDDDGKNTADLANFVAQNMPLTIKEILDRRSNSKEDRARTQHNLWWLIAAGSVWINLDEPITFDTQVFCHPIADTYGLFFSRFSFE